MIYNHSSESVSSQHQRHVLETQTTMVFHALVLIVFFSPAIVAKVASWC